jgi:hypothetical protein
MNINPRVLNYIRKNKTENYVIKNNLRINTVDPPRCTVDISASDAILIPSGTANERPANPVGGMIRYNTQSGIIEYYNDISGIQNWQSLFDKIVAIGGIITDIIDNGVEYRIHTFTTVGEHSFTVLSGSGEVEYLVVAGGGAGSCGGGGAGGVLQGSTNVIINTYNVIVGEGGTGLPGVFVPSPQPGTWRDERGTNGGNSLALSFTAVGGGAGGAYGDGGVAVRDGANGGSGGGGGGLFTNETDTAGGNGTSGQGNNGGRSSSVVNAGAGGGGGAGAIGSNGTSSSGGAGGIGILSNINGSNTYYGGGGSGGAITFGSGDVAGGLGGGGFGTNNAASDIRPSGNGTPNTGGGGGGTGSPSGNGGSGIVIIRYKL